MPHYCRLFLLAILAFSTADSKQCENPLFTTHWSGKNDIQTLTADPVVKTNLKLCPSYNQRASCCHQTFESEQQKFFNFWRQIFEEKLLRADLHRQAVLASMKSSVSSTDREQYNVVLARYSDFLAPRHQTQCFSQMLTYVAGMVCFSCNPSWSHYTVRSGRKILRLRIATSCCRDLWEHCKNLGGVARALDAAIDDSAVARNASTATEDLGMFYSQQSLCDWMHDQVALHPFRLPTKEDDDVGTVGNRSSRSPVTRRLQLEEALNVLHEGRASTFDRTWPGVTGLRSGSGAMSPWFLLALFLLRFELSRS